MKNETAKPKVSFILPTFNAEQYLNACLDSIFSLDYQQDKIEILVADGGSTDQTLEILKSYSEHKNLIVFDNPKRIAEDGKYLAYKKSTGDFLILFDSDNVIASKDWLTKLLKPLQEDPTIIGVESNYLIAKDFTSINTYANLLVIVDPVARMVASKPEKIEKKGDYVVKTFAIGSAPVSGANGFIWRKNIVDKYIKGEVLSEANLLWQIAQKEPVKIANVPGAGIYHYYCTTLGDYIKKRQKIAKKFLKRQSEEDTWVDSGKGNTNLYMPTLYLGTVVGPTIEGISSAAKQKNVAWLWHPLISPLTVAIYTYYFILSKAKK